MEGRTINIKRRNKYVFLIIVCSRKDLRKEIKYTQSYHFISLAKATPFYSTAPDMYYIIPLRGERVWNICHTLLVHHFRILSYQSDSSAV